MILIAHVVLNQVDFIDLLNKLEYPVGTLFDKHTLKAIKNVDTLYLVIQKYSYAKCKNFSTWYYL